MARSRTITRRGFLAGAAQGIGIGIAAPAVCRAGILGASDRPVIGHIGMGGRGSANLRAFLKDSAAVCDVDRERLEKARRAGGDGRELEGYSDFRKLIDRKDIDALVISTPDHWHALPAVRACEAGKDVYCEKPLTLTIAEGRAMAQAARRHGRIVQTGSQQRSDGRFRLACELVRSGRLGKLEKVLVGIPGVNWEGPPVPDCNPPEGLDYDFWLGPAPRRPYNPKRVHYHFRFFWDYSGGQITNWGAHHLDIAQWGLGADGSGPVEIEGEAKFHPEGWYEVPQHFRIIYRYSSGAVVECGMGLPGGATFIGSRGKIHVNRGTLESEPEEIIREPLGDGDVHLYASANHYQNWLDCMKSRKPTICDFEIGHRSATVCHLGNIAIKTGRKIRWDPETEKIIADEEAARLVSKPYRAPWAL
jgi:predicted dehydrogenase